MKMQNSDWRESENPTMVLYNDEAKHLQMRSAWFGER